MNAKSKRGAPERRSSASVSSAGARRSSILSATPASAQNLLAIAVHSALTSQQITRPSSGSARATASADAPVKVPISRQRRAPVSRTSQASSLAWSGPISIPAIGSLAVSARSRRQTSSSAA